MSRQAPKEHLASGTRGTLKDALRPVHHQAFQYATNPTSSVKLVVAPLTTAMESQVQRSTGFF